MTTGNKTPSTQDQDLVQPLDHHIPSPPADLAELVDLVGRPATKKKPGDITPQDHHIPLGETK
ncbi:MULTISPECIES: hypothetical protein [Streptomyces]|uniref:hypothetical protein n=1 Tax=Streptomyces TaxID=1883 RepID=UPI0036BBE82A